MKRQLVFFVILFASQYGLAHETSFSPSDSITKEQTLKSDTIITTKKTSLFSRFLNYFEESNREKKQKKFDISFIIAPIQSWGLVLSHRAFIAHLHPIVCLFPATFRYILISLSLVFVRLEYVEHMSFQATGNVLITIPLSHIFLIIYGVLGMTWGMTTATRAK